MESKAGSRDWVKGRGARGAAMVEALLALPLFLMLVLAVIQYGLVFSREMAVRRALAVASSAFEGVSAVQNISETACFQKAGEVFWAELRRLGIGLSEVNMVQPAAGGDAFVLAGMPYSFAASASAASPPAYELMAYYTPRCALCGLLPLRRGFPVATVSLIESGFACRRTGSAGQAAAFYPQAAGTARVKLVAAALIPY
jgi:hypothetical protein